MDKITHYRKLVEEVLRRHHRPARKGLEVEEQMIADREHDHYQILTVGWLNDDEPVYQCKIHMDIRDGKIWIQRDFTEIGVANELVALGVPKEDIVLAFYAPFMREDTGFAAA